MDKLLKNGISGAMLQELLDPSSVVRHLDCCAHAGCPTGKCNQLVEDWNGKVGKGMLTHLESKGVKG